MKPSDKDSSKGLGMFFSIALHVGVVVLILYWGFSGASQYSSTPGPIQVSLSGLETGGSTGANTPPAKKAAPKPKPPEPEKEEKKEEVKKEEIEPPPPPPEKKEPEKKEEEPKEKEKPKEEVVKKEPEKKKVIPLETEKEEKKEVAQKPEPTPKATAKPKPTPTPTPKPKPKPTKKAAKKKDFEKEKDRILKDIQRQKVLDELKKDKSDTEEPPEQIEEEMGEEQRLAMADDLKKSGEPESEGSAARSSSGGSSISPLIIQTYSNQVHKKISRNWRIPPGVPTDGGISTSLVFKVDASGNVNNVRITESSGNSVFDNYCRQAIIRSAPLPPPPAELAEEAKNRGIELTFRPDI